MGTHDVMITRWHKMGHSMYAPNKNLYDHYWEKGHSVSVPRDWLENTLHDFGFDYIPNFLNEVDGTEEQHGIANDIVAKANEDKVSSKPFLYYMHNKMTSDVIGSCTTDLLHDAYTCRDLYFGEPESIQKERAKKYPLEVKALTFLYRTIEHELLFRLSKTVDVDKEIPDSYYHIEFLRFASPDSLKSANLSDTYYQLYKLHCFFGSVKEPLKKKAANEYEHCKIMKEALEIKLLKNLQFASNAGLI